MTPITIPRPNLQKPSIEAEVLANLRVLIRYKWHLLSSTKYEWVEEEKSKGVSTKTITATNLTSPHIFMVRISVTEDEESNYYLVCVNLGGNEDDQLVMVPGDPFIFSCSREKPNANVLTVLRIFQALVYAYERQHTNFMTDLLKTMRLKMMNLQASLKTRISAALDKPE